MADKKISELTELTTPDGTEELVVNDSGVSKKITQANLFKLGDNVKAKFGAGNDLQIYHDGSHSYIEDSGTGNLRIDAQSFQIRKQGTAENIAGFAADGAVSLFYDGAEKLATTATGIDVTGSVTCDGFTSTGIDDNATSTAITIDASENVTLTGTVNGLEINTTATSNLGLGTGAVDSITTGDYNVGVGDYALTANTTGTDNTAVGRFSLYSNTTGNNNVAFGRDSLRNNIGSYNSAFGAYSLNDNTTGVNNTAIGYGSLSSNTTANNNTAIGIWSLDDNTTGSNNTATGYSALTANTTGASNTAVGRSALAANTTANNNTAVGYLALTANTTGVNNSAIGYQALYSCTTGGYNHCQGDTSLTALTTGIVNTAMGHYTGTSITTGSGNICLGKNAGRSGYGVFTPTTENERIVMGSSSVTNAYIQVAWTVTSDQRDKTDIIDFTHGLNYITKLRPVNYVWDERSNYENGIPDGTKKKSQVQLGFLAQEVQAVETSLGINNDCIVDTEVEDLLKITETKLIPVLVNAIKELSAKVEALENA